MISQSYHFLFEISKKSAQILTDKYDDADNARFDKQYFTRKVSAASA